MTSSMLCALVAIAAIVGIVIAALAAILCGRHLRIRFDHQGFEAVSDALADGTEKAHEANAKLREQLLTACGGKEDTLALMLDVADGKTSLREIATAVGKNNTTVWRSYQRLLSRMATRLSSLDSSASCETRNS